MPLHKIDHTDWLKETYIMYMYIHVHVHVHVFMYIQMLDIIIHKNGKLRSACLK